MIRVGFTDRAGAGRQVSVITCAVLFCATAASAQTLQLKLQAGASTIIVLDNAPGDSNPSPGVVTFFGPVGDYTLNIITALSKPVLGSPAHASMDLNVTSFKGGAQPQTLTMSLSDVDFVGPINGTVQLFSAVGGTTSAPT